MSALHDDHLTLKGACELLAVSTTRGRQLILAGKLEGSKEGSRYRIPRASVYARISSQDTPPGVQRLLYRAASYVNW